MMTTRETWSEYTGARRNHSTNRTPVQRIPSAIGPVIDDEDASDEEAKHTTKTAARLSLLAEAEHQVEHPAPHGNAMMDVGVVVEPLPSEEHATTSEKESKKERNKKNKKKKRKNKDAPQSHSQSPSSEDKDAAASITSNTSAGKKGSKKEKDTACWSITAMPLSEDSSDEEEDVETKGSRQKTAMQKKKKKSKSGRTSRRSTMTPAAKNVVRGNSDDDMEKKARGSYAAMPTSSSDDSDDHDTKKKKKKSKKMPTIQRRSTMSHTSTTTAATTSTSNNHKATCSSNDDDNDDESTPFRQRHPALWRKIHAQQPQPQNHPYLRPVLQGSTAGKKLPTVVRVTEDLDEEPPALAGVKTAKKRKYRVEYRDEKEEKNAAAASSATARPANAEDDDDAVGGSTSTTQIVYCHEDELQERFPHIWLNIQEYQKRETSSNTVTTEEDATVMIASSSWKYVYPNDRVGGGRDHDSDSTTATATTTIHNDEQNDDNDDGIVNTDDNSVVVEKRTDPTPPGRSTTTTTNNNNNNCTSRSNPLPPARHGSSISIMRFLHSSIPVIITIMLLRDGMAATTSPQTDDNVINGVVVDTRNETVYYDERIQCDESKCAGSQGISADGSVFHYAFNGSFNCYSGISKYNGFSFPPMCVDGYIPHVLEKGLNLTLDYDDIDEDDIDLFLDQYPVDKEEYWHYYTCCPPSVLSSSSKTKNIIRHCSDPIIKNNDSGAMDMDCSRNDDQRYNMRPMKNNSNKIMGGRVWVESFVCCDTPAIDDNNFLNETECVPYMNEYYRSGRIFENKYAILSPIRCNTTNTDFQYPKRNKDETAIYGCCKTIDEDTKPFIEDTAFYATLYPQIVLSSLAVIACTILIVALMIPLVDYLREQSSLRSAHPNTVIMTSATSSASTCNYSSYNLYLLYLALPDLILNVYILAMYCSYANQKDNPDFNGLIIKNNITDAGSVFEVSILVSASTANLFLNCVVSYEIMLLLKNNNRVVRHQPPSLLRVTSQASAVYIFSIVVFTVTVFMAKAALEQIILSNNYSAGNKIFLAIRITLILVTYVLPIGFFVSIWIIIQVRGYLPSLTGREKELTLFFLRIAVVFGLFWIPGMCFVIIGVSRPDNPVFSGNTTTVRLYQVGLYFVSLQPIASTLMAMTKTDVKNYTKKLLTLSYVFNERNKTEEDDSE